MAKRKATHFESKDLSSEPNPSKIVDQKYILLELLSRIKDRSDVAEKRLGKAMGRIDKLEEITKDILHSLKQHLKDCEKASKSHGEKANFEALASKFVRNLEKRLSNLEVSVENTNKRLSASAEEKQAIMEKVRELQKEAQITKQACMEIILHEVKKSKDHRGDWSNPLSKYVEEMQYPNQYEYYEERKPKKQKRGAHY